MEVYLASMVTHAQYFRPVWQREGYEDTLPPNDLMSSLDSMKDEETRYLDHYLAGLMCSKYHDPELYPKDCSDYRALLSECLAAVVRGVNILESFAYCKDGFELPMIRNAKRFILDSGAFTFMASHPKNLDWDDYLRRYGEYVRDNGIERFMELDIDSIVGYPRVLELRSELERIAERPCIPVWHKSRGIEEFRRMCEDYDYVAIGGIVNGELARKEYRFLPALIKEAHDRGARIHGLGFTNQSWLPKCHFDSVDSSSWTCGRFGTAIRFTGHGLENIDKPDEHNVNYMTWLNNYWEFVKFQRWAEVYL